MISEIGVANMLLCRDAGERQAALRAIAGATAFGHAALPNVTAGLRERGIVMLAEDLGVMPDQATRALLAARGIEDLVDASAGLYEPPPQFRHAASKA